MANVARGISSLLHSEPRCCWPAQHCTICWRKLAGRLPARAWNSRRPATAGISSPNGNIRQLKKRTGETFRRHNKHAWP